MSVAEKPAKAGFFVGTEKCADMGLSGGAAVAFARCIHLTMRWFTPWAMKKMGFQTMPRIARIAIEAPMAMAIAMHPLV